MKSDLPPAQRQLLGAFACELAQALRRLLGYTPPNHTATAVTVKPIKRPTPPKSQHEPKSR